MTPDARTLAPILIFGLTSLGAYLVGAVVHGLRPAALSEAMRDVLEALGLGVLFLLANLAVGAVVVLGARRLTGHFVSIYLLSDVTLPMLSLVQALVFQHWRERSK
jgi:hypothetical protein